MSAGCWLFHRWGKWEQYRERGWMIGGILSPVRGKQFRYTELRQKRKCLDCGFVQDELIKDEGEE